MADRNGYIGRAPGDSSVVVARQVFSPSGVQTDFTFASGYTVGYLDAYLNGVRLIEGQDYSATDTSTVGLTSFAQSGDVLELVAYKAFNISTAGRIGIQSSGVTVGNVDTLNFIGLGNTFSLSGTTIDVSISGSAGAAGTWSNYDSNTGVTTTKKVRIGNDLEVTGVATATSFKGSAQVGVATGGTYIGLATQFNFVGSGVSVTHAYDATVGIATINLFVEASAGGGGGGDFNTGIASATAYAVTTAMATAYTAPATAGARHIVHSIHVTNIDGTTSADISGQLYAGEYSIANTIPVPPGSAVELLKQPKILSPSETIQLQSSATGDLHATITIETKAGDTTYIGVGTDITSAATYTDLHIATADTMLQSVLLANDDGAADVKANVVWTDGSNTIQGYYAFEMTIPADATVEILEKPKFLPNGFKVRVLANQANRLEAILSAKTI